MKLSKPQVNAKKPTPRYIIMLFLKTEAKKKILKVARRKPTLYREILILIIVDFSSESMGVV